MFDKFEVASNSLNYGEVARQQIEDNTVKIKEGQWSSIQIKNVNKVLSKANVMTDLDERALAEFIKVTHSDGQQLPFGSILDCIVEEPYTGQIAFKVNG